MKNKKISCVECPNDNCPIKQYCTDSPENLDEILQHKNTNSYIKEQQIFREENYVDGIYFVQSGRVKVYKTNHYEKNQIIRLVSNGGIIGHRALANNEKYTISAQAMSDVVACSFEKSFFINLLKKVPALSFHLLLFFANELNDVEAKLSDLSFFNVRQKVAKALLVLVKNFVLSPTNSINYFDELSRQDIGDIVGLNANQVTKILAEFKEEKLIETNGKEITIINLKKLNEIILA